MDENNIALVEEIKNKLFDSSKELGAAIVNSAEFNGYVNARKNFVSNDEAKKILLSYSQMVRKLNESNNGTSSNNIIEELDQKKKQMYENSILKAYFNAEEELVKLFKELNLYISTKLNFDFASFSKSQNSCCS